MSSSVTPPPTEGGLPPLRVGRPPPPARRLDPGVVVAVAWLGVAVGLTLLLGPRLGLRGWAWLGLHHALCLLGCAHELRRGWRRRSRA